MGPEGESLVDFPFFEAEAPAPWVCETVSGLRMPLSLAPSCALSRCFASSEVQRERDLTHALAFFPAVLGHELCSEGVRVAVRIVKLNITYTEGIANARPAIVFVNVRRHVRLLRRRRRRRLQNRGSRLRRYRAGELGESFGDCFRLGLRFSKVDGHSGRRFGSVRMDYANGPARKRQTYGGSKGGAAAC